MIVSRCCIATASPAKFLEVVQKAGLTIDLPESVRHLETKETRYKHLKRGENWETALRERIEAISSARLQGVSFYTLQPSLVTGRLWAQFPALAQSYSIRHLGLDSVRICAYMQTFSKMSISLKDCVFHKSSLECFPCLWLFNTAHFSNIQNADVNKLDVIADQSIKHS